MASTWRVPWCFPVAGLSTIIKPAGLHFRYQLVAGVEVQENFPGTGAKDIRVCDMKIPLGSRSLTNGDFPVASLYIP